MLKSAIFLTAILLQVVVAHPKVAEQVAAEKSNNNGVVSNAAFQDTGDDDNSNVLNVADNSGNPALKFNAATRIAVIGGGPSGLFAARQLSRAGYTNVVVLEKQNVVGGLVQTINVDGHAVDFTTRFLPSINPEGPGTYPPLQAMINQYNLATRTTSAPISYVDTSSSQPIPMAMPHIFAPYFAPGGAGPNAIVADLIWGFELLRVVNSVPGITGCYSALGIPPGTTFGTWGQAVNHPAFISLAEYTNDVFLGGPSPQQDACAFLKVRTHFMPGDIVSVLRAFGLTNLTPLPISNALRSCLDPTVNFNRKMFVNGYQGLFDSIVQNENFQVITNAGVSSIKQKKNQNGIRVRFNNGGKYIFDKIIVATAPDQALNFIDDNIQMIPLLQQFTAPHVITVNAFETSPSALGPTFPPTSPRVFNSVVYPAAFQLATANMPDAVIGMNKEFDDSGVVIAIGYTYATTSNQNIKQRAKAAIQSFGYDTQGAVFSTAIAYPISVPASATGVSSTAPSGFFARVDALQGDSGYYFVGESFAGYGIPPILAETIRVMSTQFLS